jgi:DNA-binding SARP family transcriptional activator
MALSFPPRMALTVIRRPRLEDWLARFKNVPIRFLVGPPGCGKTTAALGYLIHSKTTGLYCTVPKGASAQDMRTLIARSMQWDTTNVSHGAVIRALVESSPCELAIDDTHFAAPDGIAEIHRLIEELPESVAVLIISRSRTAIDVSRLLARGMASLCDAERLAFDAAEVRHLAETCGVSFTHADVARILEATDGWPMVVSGAIRKAAEDGRNLSEAFEYWRSRQGHLFTEFVNTALEEAAPEKVKLVHRLMDGVACDDQDLLHSLEIDGLFVIHTSRGYQPLRALSRLRMHGGQTYPTRSLPPMHVRMLGRFQAEINEHPIEWIRRRDAQIFKYVALKRNGCATRAELSETFWPGAEKHLVAQSIRTAFSNIRRAIANIVGFDAIDAYVRTNGDIALNLDNVIVDVNRFVAHANDGDQQYDRNELRAAFAHYRSAETVYAGELLIGDPVEPWSAAQAAMLADRHVFVLERLAEIAQELGDHGSAMLYARHVVELKPDNEAARAALSDALRSARLHKVAAVAPETRELNPAIAKASAPA